VLEARVVLISCKNGPPTRFCGEGGSVYLSLVQCGGDVVTWVAMSRRLHKSKKKKH
jgi:hypothetical protein